MEVLDKTPVSVVAVAMGYYIVMIDKFRGDFLR